MSDELKIVLEDVKEKFDTVIEAFNMVKERLGRHEKTEEEHFERIEGRLDRHEATQGERLQGIEGKLTTIEDKLILFQKDFNEHRDNTEIHAVKKKKRAS